MGAFDLSCHGFLHQLKSISGMRLLIHPLHYSTDGDLHACMKKMSLMRNLSATLHHPSHFKKKICWLWIDIKQYLRLIQEWIHRSIDSNRDLHAWIKECATCTNNLYRDGCFSRKIFCLWIKIKHIRVLFVDEVINPFIELPLIEIYMTPLICQLVN